MVVLVAMFVGVLAISVVMPVLVVGAITIKELLLLLSVLPDALVNDVVKIDVDDDDDGCPEPNRKMTHVIVRTNFPK